MYIYMHIFLNTQTVVGQNKDKIIGTSECRARRKISA